MADGAILVTGAAGARRGGTSAQGSTGYRVTRLLLERAQPVRAFVHTLDERADELRELGAEVVQGDLHDLGSVRSAMEGVRRSYFTYPVQPGLVEATATFAAAAREADSELVVNLSQLLSRRDGGRQPTPHQDRHWLAEQLLDWAGVGAVHLNAVIFYENLWAMASGSLAAAGVVALPWGPASTRIPLIAAEDVARVAAGLLTGDPLPNGTIVPLIGAIVSNQEIAGAFAETLGRPVRHVEVSEEQWLESISGAGINDAAVEHLVHLWRYLRSGEPQRQDGFGVTDAIERLGGSPPRSLADHLRDASRQLTGGTIAG
jgi:uncharacterized protein YbjT (DUF2867 family)